MSSILEAVENCLNEDGWKFQIIDGSDMIETGVKGENATFKIYFHAKEVAQQLLLLVFSPSHIPQERRVHVAEYITRANYGLSIGNFEMDMEDGELRYRVAVDIEGNTFTFPMIRNMLFVGITSMDRYYPGLMSVTFANIAPKDAIAQIEMLPPPSIEDDEDDDEDGGDGGSFV